MKIRNILHRGLRDYVEFGDRRGLDRAIIPKLTRVISFLQAMAQAEELYDLKAWKAHVLTGDRRGTWSLSITRNWRLTFRVDGKMLEIIDLNYEDYH
ncbi:MAG: type II toxin-antitoxin system RelE/ParE family toxin [Candidatus Symbiobacter sp.]|nr:type II toxin-antitoxin system RelE/ParE family toxin [Candidatus Symbiobacter sp.]